MATVIRERTRLPDHIILEVLGSVSFSSDPEKDIHLAEEIAGSSYSDMAQLISTIEGCIENERLKKQWNRSLLDLRVHPMFSAYFFPEDTNIKYFEWRKKPDNKRGAGRMLVGKVLKPPFEEDGEIWMHIRIGDIIHHVYWHKIKRRWESGDI